MNKQQIVSFSQNKIIDFEDNILAWVDTDTDLMWEVKNKDNINYKYVLKLKDLKLYYEYQTKNDLLDPNAKDAQSYVDYLNSINYCNYKDWRIPTINELKTILTSEESKSNGYNDEYYYIKEPLSKNSETDYWSIDNALYNDEKILYMHFYQGRTDECFGHQVTFLRCVRS